MSNLVLLKSRHGKQRGLTLVGFLLMLVALIFVAYLAMKIVPIYVNYFSVARAMDGMKDTPGLASRSPMQIRDALYDRLYVSYMDDLTDKNVKITRSNGVNVRVVYAVRENIMGNLDIIVSFDRSIKLN
jgi:hypothetical protein